MKKTLKWSLVMMLAVFGLTFASCSDDDDETPTVPTVEEVVGEYSGKMTYAIAKAAASEEVPGTTLDLTVKNDSINFDKFPFEALVKAIIPNEEAANGIIAQVKEVKYKVGYKAKMNAANDSVGSYAVNKKNLKFNLTATEAKLGDTNALPAPIVLSFDMTKK